MNISKYLEMRNLVLIEPETKEFVQVTYLCDMDSHITESELLNKLGGLKNVGNANDKILCLLVYIQYLYIMNEMARLCVHEKIQLITLN